MTPNTEKLRVVFLRTHRSTDGANISIGTKVELPRELAQKLIADGDAAPASMANEADDERVDGNR